MSCSLLKKLKYGSLSGILVLKLVEALGWFICLGGSLQMLDL